MVSVDAPYQFILNKVGAKDYKIKHQLLDVVKLLEVDEFGDIKSGNLKAVMSHVEEEYDYSFYDDELIKVKKMINPTKLVPQEGLRYSIISDLQR